MATSTVGAVTGSGNETDQLGADTVEILLHTHADFVESQRTSGSRVQLVYGSIWADLPHRLCIGLSQRRRDVTIQKIGHGGYEVPTIGDTIYFPWRPRGGARPEDAIFGGSHRREGLWRVRRDQDTLPLVRALDDGVVFDREADGSVVAPIADLLSVDVDTARVVIVAMTSTADHLDRIESGEARLAEDGKLIWEPQTLWTGADNARPADPGAGSFASGDHPKPLVAPRTQAPRSDEVQLPGSTGAAANA